MDEQKPIIDITSEPTFVPAATAVLSRSPFLVRRRGTLLITLALALAALAAWAWMQPNRYRASGTILISRLGPSPAPVTDAELASEMEIIRSRAGDLTTGLGSSSRVVESIQAAETRRAQLKNTVALQVVRNSQVIEVSFTDPSRKTAADSVNALLDLYIEARSRLYSSPQHVVPVEAEGAILQGKADKAAQELWAFDQNRNGATARDEHEIRNRQRTLIEERTLQLKSEIRGQEEILRVLRQRSGEYSAEAVQAEARLAGLKAQLAEMEKALGPVAQAQTLTAIVAAQREELKQRMERATSHADQLALRLQEARITGVSLQARILARAEPAVVHPWSTAPWWTLVLAAAAVILVSLIIAWIVDSFDRPVYDDDDFANMTGAPPVQSRAAGAGSG